MILISLRSNERSTCKSSSVRLSIKYTDFLEGEWLASKAINLRDVTLKTYKSNIAKHIIPYFKNKEMSKITTQIIEKFYSHLSMETGLAGRIIQDIHKIVKSSFKTAIKRKYLSYNPAYDAEAPEVPHKEMSVWNLEETTSFLKLAERNDLYIAFHLALTTGMRQFEILGLRWKDVDFVENALHVRQTLSHDSKQLVQDTKTKSSARTISLIERTLDDLKKHHKIIKQQLVVGSLYQDNDLMICTKFGKSFNPLNLLRRFYKLMKKADVPKIRFHDIRHTVATLMLARKINLKVAKEILGHSDIRVLRNTQKRKSVTNFLGISQLDFKS